MMKETLLQRVWAWLHETFPERQVYIRSDGRVQFFTFGPSLQATLAGLTLIFLGWVAFATVNVIFKDRIITAKDHRYQQMQAAYENRQADLQISYDELNGALVAAEDQFKATADGLQAKQNAITGFLNKEKAVQGMMGARPAAATMAAPQAADPGLPLEAGDGPAADSLDAAAPSGFDQGGGSDLSMMPGDPAPQPRTAKPTKSSFLEPGFGASLSHVFATVKTRIAALFASPVPASHPVALRHPALKALYAQTKRVRQMGQGETLLMAQTQGALRHGVSDVETMMRRTGINPDQMERRLGASEGMGGPEIPLDQAHVEGVTDPAFTKAYLDAAGVLSQLDDLSQILGHMPLAMPVNAAGFDRSSGFGARLDPFTRRYAFHPGIDFAGAWGAPVMATAAGTVVFAGNRGGYGNMVEIDHGFGLHTRYGHLSAITVRVGARIAKGNTLGRVGSTGRSTGPHVHYEVLYDNVVRNPANFIEAGRHVL